MVELIERSLRVIEFAAMFADMLVLIVAMLYLLFIVYILLARSACRQNGQCTNPAPKAAPLKTPKAAISTAKAAIFCRLNLLSAAIGVSLAFL
jgi:hypothetical protein